MGIVRRARVAAVIAVAALAAAGVAFAVDSERTRTVAVPSFDAAHVTTRCSGDQVADGGGVRAATNRKKGVIVSGFRPSGGRAMRVSGTNVFVNDSALAVTVHCVSPEGLTTVKKSRVLPAITSMRRPRRLVVARCPEGTAVRFAGFQAAVSPQPNGAVVVVDRLVRSSVRTVKVDGVNRGPAKGTLTAYAKCGANVGVKTIARSVDLPAKGGRAAVGARCPHHLTASFGGFATTPSNGNGPYMSGMQRTANGRWKVRAFGFAREHAQLTAFAYCAGKSP